jgi:hypothetical protein
MEQSRTRSAARSAARAPAAIAAAALTFAALLVLPACRDRSAAKPPDAHALALLGHLPASDDFVVTAELVALLAWLRGPAAPPAGASPSGLEALGACLVADHPAHRHAAASAAFAGRDLVVHLFVEARALREVTECARQVGCEVAVEPDGQTASVLLRGDGVPALDLLCAPFDAGVLCRMTAGSGGAAESFDRARAALDRVLAELPLTSVATDARYAFGRARVELARPVVVLQVAEAARGPGGAAATFERGLTFDAVEQGASEQAAERVRAELQALIDGPHAGSLDQAMSAALRGTVVERRGAEVTARLATTAAQGRALGELLVGTFRAFPSFAIKDAGVARFTSNQISLLLDAMWKCATEDASPRHLAVCACELDLSMSRTLAIEHRDEHCASYAEMILAQEKLDPAARQREPFRSASPEIPAPGSLRLFTFSVPCKALAVREHDAAAAKVCACFTRVLANRLANRTDLKTLADVDAAVQEEGAKIMTPSNLCMTE